MAILDDEIARQFYADGGYIQQSHNYHRTAIHLVLCAQWFLRERTPPSWLSTLERSLTFLVAHQSPVDGRLPNYGANDGSLPLVLSTCDYSDFRPTLQTLSILTRGERLYDAGPWDEQAAWLLGPEALSAPIRSPERRSVGFSDTGFHVLRAADPRTFCTFRCGTLRDRFSQIDMLHVDVWWRGHNVLVDPGSFQYNGADAWHDHFYQTASHNTVVVDGRDQMLHYRRFKNLYWTEAKLLRSEAGAGWSLCEGEHYAYRRQAGKCVHRRSVLLVGNDLVVVVDHLLGTGEHDLRLHWLGGDFPFVPLPRSETPDCERRAANNDRDDIGGLELTTPDGSFRVSVHDARGQLMRCTVAAGSDEPPRGWLSRYYGQKVPVPSLAVEHSGPLPTTLVTVLSAGPGCVSVKGNTWTVSGPSEGVTFALRATGIETITRCGTAATQPR
jgi:asparagine synthase (glutamine-hydrolysing)